MFFHRLGRAAMLTFGLILLLAVSILSYGYIKRFPQIYGFIHPSSPAPNEFEYKPEEEMQETADVSSFAEETGRIAADAKIVLRRLYTSCNHILTEDLVNKYTGKTRQELAEMFPGWQLVTFSAERAVFHITIDGYCPDHYIVKHEDGMVVIYRPDMDTGIPLVVEATDIPYDRLSPEVKQELQEGIVVYGIEGVENLLENWGS